MFKELFQQDQSPELSQNLKFTTDSDSFTCGQRCLVGCHGNRPKESGESRSKPQLNHRFPGSSFFSLYYEIKTSSSHFLVMLMFSSRQFIFPCLTPPSPSRRTNFNLIPRPKSQVPTALVLVCVDAVAVFTGYWG